MIKEIDVIIPERVEKQNKKYCDICNEIMFYYSIKKCAICKKDLCVNCTIGIIEMPDHFDCCPTCIKILQPQIDKLDQLAKDKFNVKSNICDLISQLKNE